jgi:hypothetical protein
MTKRHSESELATLPARAAAYLVAEREAGKAGKLPHSVLV